MFEPSYIQLLKNGELEKRVIAAWRILESCTMCPSNCKVNRLQGELGTCYSRALPIVSSYTPHFGEEPVLSGTRGAGNIFFGNCNLNCVYCQNHEISQNRRKELENEVSCESLADMMLELQEKGCHNIGLVSPTHFAIPILKAIHIAAQKGLHIPIIYNSNGYDSVEVLKLFEGVVDIYLPDFKYGNNEYGKTYSKVEDYFSHAGKAIQEMYRQVGKMLIYDDDVVVRGLIIRHLVLPNDLSETEEVLRFISEQIAKDIHISLMSQYYPANKAGKHILLNRTLRESEYNKAISLMQKYGLTKGWVQEPDSSSHYRPEFENSRNNPFQNI
jgi:putative pyruvate formate lyase activating enzyme